MQVAGISGRLQEFAVDAPFLRAMTRENHNSSTLPPLYARSEARGISPISLWQ